MPRAEYQAYAVGEICADPGPVKPKQMGSNRLLEQENEILRQAVAYIAQEERTF
jgi:hypothetical protein